MRVAWPNKSLQATATELVSWKLFGKFVYHHCISTQAPVAVPELWRSPYPRWMLPALLGKARASRTQRYSVSFRPTSCAYSATRTDSFSTGVLSHGKK